MGEKRVEDVEDVKAFVEAAKNQIENPLAGGVVVRKKSREKQNDNLTKFVNTKLTKDLVHDAAATQARHKAMEAKARAELVKVEEDKYVFFLACRQYHHHGVYFTCNPKYLSRITDKDWYADGYKELDDTNGIGHFRGHPFCQVCYAERGEENLLPIIWIDERRGHWRPEPRWAYMVANNARDLKRDGTRAIRIMELPEELSNRHFEDLAQAREDFDKQEAEDRREQLVAEANKRGNDGEFAATLLKTKAGVK